MATRHDADDSPHPEEGTDGTEAPAGLPAEPQLKLAPEARTLWRLSGLGTAAMLVPGPLAAGWLLPGRGDTLVLLLWGIWAGYAVVQVALVPELLWRRWRYEIRADEVDIRRGTFTVTRTLVPMQRVQHVDTEQGPLQGAVGDVATIAVHTAAGRNEIPHLRVAEAARVRDRILELTKAPDEL